MKSRLVDRITSNEDSVRMRIFDGELPADEATAELLRIERAQHDAARRLLRAACAMIEILNGRWAGHGSYSDRNEKTKPVRCRS